MNKKITGDFSREEAKNWLKNIEDLITEDEKCLLHSPVVSAFKFYGFYYIVLEDGQIFVAGTDIDRDVSYGYDFLVRMGLLSKEQKLVWDEIDKEQEGRRDADLREIERLRKKWGISK